MRHLAPCEAAPVPRLSQNYLRHREQPLCSALLGIQQPGSSTPVPSLRILVWHLPSLWRHGPVWRPVPPQKWLPAARSRAGSLHTQLLAPPCLSGRSLVLGARHGVPRTWPSRALQLGLPGSCGGRAPHRPRLFADLSFHRVADRTDAPPHCCPSTLLQAEPPGQRLSGQTSPGSQREPRTFVWLDSAP